MKQTMFSLGASNYILVADRDYFPLLLSLREANPCKKLKFFTPQDVYDRLGINFAASFGNPIASLLKKGISYEKAKQYLSLLKTIGPSSNEKLGQIASYLTPGSMIKNPYGRREMRGEVLLVEQGMNLELQAFLKKNGIAFRSIGLQELGFHQRANPQEVRLYDDPQSLFYDLFGHIRKRLISHPEDRKSLSIHIGESDFYYAKNVAKLFDIDLFLRFKRPLRNEKDVQLALKDIEKRRSFELASSESASLKKLASLIAEYDLAGIPDFSFAFVNLLDILKSTQMTSLSTGKGIAVFTNYLISASKSLYVSDFRDGDFYDIKTDKNVFSDDELSAMGANPSYVKTMLDERKKSDFILYQDIAFLARPLKHLNDHIYDSPLLGKLGLKNRKIDPIAHFEGLATTKSQAFLKAGYLDSVFMGEAYGDYRSYDSRPPKGLALPKRSKHYSLTNLESYPKCPYMYYLGELLASPIEDPFFMTRGRAIHSFFEDIEHPSFDFDASFERAMKEFCDATRDTKGSEPSAKDMIMMDIVKDVLRATKGFYDEFRHTVKRVDALDAERPVYFTLEDERGSYEFKGRIDKLLITENESTHERFYTIIDYKSGSESFIPQDCFIGKSVQLPLYYYAIESVEQDEHDDFTHHSAFGGLGIAHNFFREPSALYLQKDNKGQFQYSEEKMRESLRLEGVFLAKPSYYQTIDPSLTEEKKGKRKRNRGIYLHETETSLYDKPDGDYNLIGLKKGETIWTYNLDDLINDAKTGILNIIHAIEEGDFPIKPEKFTKSSQCDYCLYGDICYRKPMRDKSHNDIIKANHLAKMKYQKGKETGGDDHDA